MNIESINNKKIRRCIKCIMPETQGHITLDESDICNICNERKDITIRRGNLNKENDLSTFKKKILFYTQESSKYDCVVSVSGGKDSLMTLYIAKKILKLRVLAVFIDNGFALPEMYSNVNSASEILGVDLIIYKTNDFAEIFKKMHSIKKRNLFL